MPTSSPRPPKIVYLVTEDWAFWLFRRPMALAARDAGMEVVVATRVDAHAECIAGLGFRVVPLNWRRRSLNPIDALRSVAEIVRLYRWERPDIVHHVAMKPVLLGGLAAWLAGVPAVVNALTGLGTLFIGTGGAGVAVIGAAARFVLRFVLNRPGSLLLLQNRDDRILLQERGLITAERVRLVRGSGIDIRHFDVLPEPPEPPVTIAYVGRLLTDKGVHWLVEAFRRLREERLDVRLILAGTPDPENPTSIPPGELERWRALPGVELPGQVDDVRTVWARAHIAVLISRREGLPKSLLEAAACGRAIVASDVPGCREIAEAGHNALTVPLGDVAALTGALETLVRDAGLRRRFGEASRRLVESDMAAERVGAATLAVYGELLGTARGRSPAIAAP